MCTWSVDPSLCSKQFDNSLAPDTQELFLIGEGVHGQTSLIIALALSLASIPH